MVYEYKGRWMRSTNECFELLKVYYCDFKERMEGCVYSD